MQDAAHHDAMVPWAVFLFCFLMGTKMPFFFNLVACYLQVVSNIILTKNCSYKNNNSAIITHSRHHILKT